MCFVIYNLRIGCQYRQSQTRGQGFPSLRVSCIQYQKEIVFRRIVISATRPLAKVTGFHPATALHISWGSSATSAEARSDFLEYLHERGLPEDFTKRCGLLFDNAVAVDEDGNFCD